MQVLTFFPFSACPNWEQRKNIGSQGAVLGSQPELPKPRKSSHHILNEISALHGFDINANFGEYSKNIDFKFFGEKLSNRN